MDALRRQYFEKGAFGDQRISRFQRSIKRQSPHPARWAGLLHFAPSALKTTTCQSHDLMSQVCLVPSRSLALGLALAAASQLVASSLIISGSPSHVHSGSAWPRSFSIRLPYHLCDRPHSYLFPLSAAVSY